MTTYQMMIEAMTNKQLTAERSRLLDRKWKKQLRGRERKRLDAIEAEIQYRQAMYEINGL
jgi:hypothetical protein